VNDDEHHDMDAPNLDIEGEPRGPLHLMDPNRLFLEDNASESFGPSVTKRIFRASAAFSFLVLVGVGGAIAWRFGGDQAIIRAWALPASTTQPAVPPAGAAEIQQQLKSIATDLAAVKHTLDQLDADQDQLTRKQEEMAGKQEQMTQVIATLQTAEQDIRQKISAPPPANRPVHVPLPKPVQHPAQLSTQASSNPTHVSPPQSLLPPKPNLR
jgi:hypothetical protein